MPRHRSSTSGASMWRPRRRFMSRPWRGSRSILGRGRGSPVYEPEPNSVNRARSAAARTCPRHRCRCNRRSTRRSSRRRTVPRRSRAEYTNFLQSERISCAPYSFQQQNDCISGMLAREHDLVTARLNGVFADEAARPVAIHVEVQQRLRSMGLLSGTADGIYGDSTRRAISAWQSGAAAVDDGRVEQRRSRHADPWLRRTAAADAGL